jgi:hypothetical protein
MRRLCRISTHKAVKINYKSLRAAAATQINCYREVSFCRRVMRAMQIKCLLARSATREMNSAGAAGTRALIELLSHSR